MEGVTLGVLIGAGATLGGTIITSIMNYAISSAQYKRELKKSFIQKKVEAYKNVCETILSITEENGGSIVTNVSQVGGDWAKNAIETINKNCRKDNLWLDEKDIEKITWLQNQFADFLFIDKEVGSNQLIRDCFNTLSYFNNQTKKIHFIKPSK